MVKALTLVLAVTLATAGATEARMHAPYRGHRIVPAATAPLDAFTQPSGAYSFRKLRSAYAGNAIRLRRASDNAELDIGFLGFVPGLGAPWNEAAANTHCAATTCFARTWYDQSGLARDVGDPANQPQLIFNCVGSLPCLRATSSAQFVYSAGPYTPASPVTFSVVANRSAGSGGCTWPTWYPNNLFGSQFATANGWASWNGSAGIAGVATDNAWHSGIATLAGAGSVVRIDGTETTGTVALSTAAGGFAAFFGADATICSVGEVIAWSGYALTPAERVALGDNQKNYWLPAPLDTFTSPSGAYSFRKLKSTYAGPAMKLRRATGGVQDINFLGVTGFTGAPWDQAAAQAFCNATTCFLDTWYDQSGLARHIVQATPASQLQLNFACKDGKPCFRGNFGQLAASAASYAWTSPISLAGVNNLSQTDGGSVQCFWVQAGSNFIQTFAAPFYLLATGNIGTTAPAVDAWHTQQGVINGAASVYNVDGTETTGTVAAITTSGPIQVAYSGPAASTCDFAEAIIWNAYALTPAERIFLTNNQRAYITP